MARQSRAARRLLEDTGDWSRPPMTGERHGCFGNRNAAGPHRKRTAQTECLETASADDRRHYVYGVTFGHVCRLAPGHVGQHECHHGPGHDTFRWAARLAGSTETEEPR